MTSCNTYSFIVKSKHGAMNDSLMPLLYFLTHHFFLGGARHRTSQQQRDLLLHIYWFKSNPNTKHRTYTVQSIGGRPSPAAGCICAAHQTVDRTQWPGLHPSPELGRSAPPKHAAASGHSSRTSRWLCCGIFQVNFSSETSLASSCFNEPHGGLRKPTNSANIVHLLQ